MRFPAVNAASRWQSLGSGAGKSTLLNLIAGFLTPASGSLTIPKRRSHHDAAVTPPGSTPFQENNLFSHLTVAQNIGAGS
ncbi:ATP-binding cassette domain-containing protein [Escherichia coli]